MMDTNNKYGPSDLHLDVLLCNTLSMAEKTTVCDLILSSEGVKTSKI
jgi:hypothetical protein